ncbi:MAG: porin [Planctomycetota bacterium]|nr:MAG: porin [Planctomycetota bacterium]
MTKFSMRTWMLMTAAGLGCAASAHAAGPVSPSILRAESLLNAPSDRLDIQLVECTTGDCATGNACTTGSCGAGGCGTGGCGTGACGTGCESDWGIGCGLFGGAGSGDPFDLGTLVFGEDSAWDIGGHLQNGYHSEADGITNTRPEKFNNHQSWLYLQKTADGSEGLDWGMRIDGMYGQDANNTQAYGNPQRDRWDFQDDFDRGAGYGFAIPQAYGTIAYDNLTVKVGHFFTYAGYEVVPSTGNFFYSHAFTWNFTEPFTHTGAVAEYAVSDDVTLHGGWVAGWDTGFARNNGSSAFHGGVIAQVSDDVSVSYMTVVGNNGWIGDGHTHHFVVTTALTDNLTHVLSSDISRGNQGIFAAAPADSTFHSVSAANYLLYTINDTLSTGARGEWLKVQGVSYYETTVGLNVRPTSNLVVRPEIRHQWSPAGEKGNNPLGVPVSETIFGIDAVMSF